MNISQFLTDEKKAQRLLAGLLLSRIKNRLLKVENLYLACGTCGNLHQVLTCRNRSQRKCAANTVNLHELVALQVKQFYIGCIHAGNFQSSAAEGD